jgi:hypothetical protein
VRYPLAPFNPNWKYLVPGTKIRLEPEGFDAPRVGVLVEICPTAAILNMDPRNLLPEEFPGKTHIPYPTDVYEVIS